MEQIDLDHGRVSANRGLVRHGSERTTERTARRRPAAAKAIPSGFNPKPAPFGVGFTGTACSEPRLLGIAYAFEQATKRRVPPPSTP